MLELKTLKNLFEDKASKSTISFSCKCSDCRNDMFIDISPVSEGFGIQGGFLFECAPGKYLAKCLNCYNRTKRHNR